MIRFATRGGRWRTSAAPGLRNVGATALLLALATTGSPARLVDASGTCTLSMVAAEPSTGEVGVAVLSSAPAGAAEVGWSRAGVGAIAVLGRRRSEVAHRGLDFLAQGVPARQALTALVREDPSPERLQAGIVDASANAAAASGRDVPRWNGQLEGTTYACMAAGCLGEGVILSMGVAFETTQGDLAERLLAGLGAGQQAQADHRRMRSAALRITRARQREHILPPAAATAQAQPEGSAAASLPAPPALDLRVDEHDDPVGELRRLLDVLDATVLHRLGSRSIEQTHGEDVLQVQEMLGDLEFYQRRVSGVLDDATVTAIRAFRRSAALADLPVLDASALEALLARHREWKRRSGELPPPNPPPGPVETELLPEAQRPQAKPSTPSGKDSDTSSTPKP
ncbi:MAG: DUF1028 domain-containing protein [Acidobacteriota bacterium]